MKLSSVLFGLLFFMICTNSQADYTITKSKHINEWQFIAAVDEMTDDKLCLVRSNTNNATYIKLYPVNKHYEVYQIVGYAGNFKGDTLTYRVDKNEAVPVYSDSDLHAKNKAVEEFKAGTKLLLKVKPENQFADTETSRISLVGFTKAWNLAVECQNKIDGK